MDNQQQEWFVIVAEKDVLTPDGRLDYAKGSVVSYGTEIADPAILATKGLKVISLGINPDLENNTFNPVTMKLEPKQGGV